MVRFFDVMSNAGIRDSFLAERMGYDRAAFSRMKQRPPGHIPMRFAEAGTRVLREIGLRKPDGSPYEVADLFFDSIVTDEDTSSSSVTEVAD
jgi:hypothetical protein